MSCCQLILDSVRSKMGADDKYEEKKNSFHDSSGEMVLPIRYDWKINEMCAEWAGKNVNANIAAAAVGVNTNNFFPEISRTSERNSPNCILWAMMRMTTLYCHAKIQCWMKTAEERCAIVHKNGMKWNSQAEVPSSFFLLTLAQSILLYCCGLLYVLSAMFACQRQNFANELSYAEHFTWRMRNITKQLWRTGVQITKKNNPRYRNEMQGWESREKEKERKKMQENRR